MADQAVEHNEVTPTQPTAQPVTVGGTVTKTSESGAKPLAGATVLARNDDGQVESAVTDAQGQYTLPPLPAGPWQLVAWHEACATQPARTVTLDASPAVQDFELEDGKPGLHLAGVACWQSDNKAVSGAQIKAIYRWSSSTYCCMLWCRPAPPPRWTSWPSWSHKRNDRCQGARQRQ